MPAFQRPGPAQGGRSEPISSFGFLPQPVLPKFCFDRALNRMRVLLERRNAVFPHGLVRGRGHRGFQTRHGYLEVRRLRREMPLVDITVTRLFNIQEKSVQVLLPRPRSMV